jgi:hypothetical protein
MYANRTRLTNQELLLRLAELEAIMASPDQDADLEKAQALAMYIARSASNGRVANLAMQAMSAVKDLQRAREAHGDRKKLPVLIDQLSTELKAASQTLTG